MTLNYGLYILSLLSIVVYEWKESYFLNISIELQKLLKLVLGKEYIIRLKTKRKGMRNRKIQLRAFMLK